MSRTAEIDRKTGETQVTVALDLDGGEVSASTGVGFLDHMLDLLGHHGRLGLRIEASGDLETGAHHTVEDVGIALGQALDRALGDRGGIRRYGYMAVPMDEALGMCAIDVSGRPLCLFEADLPATSIAGFDAELAEEFFRAVATSAKLTVHRPLPDTVAGTRATSCSSTRAMAVTFAPAGTPPSARCVSSVAVTLSPGP